jgi:hypothetical protein
MPDNTPMLSRAINQSAIRSASAILFPPRLQGPAAATMAANFAVASGAVIWELAQY